MSGRVAHFADADRPHLTACGLDWDEWQSPDRMRPDDEPTVSDLVARGLLTQIEAAEIRAADRALDQGPVAQCQACLKAALR